MPHDLKTITKWALIVTWLYMATSIFSLIDSHLYVQFLKAWLVYETDPGTSPYSFEELADWETLVVSTWWLGFVFLGQLIVTFVVNSIWIYRVSSNAAYFVPSPNRISAGWAVGWFCIPFANLFMPYRAIKQAWNSSRAESVDLTATLPAFFTVWWAAWIIGFILTQAYSRGAFSEDTSEQITAYMADYIIMPIDIVAAFLFLQIIKRLTQMQQDKDKTFVPRSGPPSPPSTQSQGDTP